MLFVKKKKRPILDDYEFNQRFKKCYSNKDLQYGLK